MTSYYVFQGTCDDVNSSAPWNLIAARRPPHAASKNPLMAIFAPQTTQAAGVAAASIITLCKGLVGIGLQKNYIGVGNPVRFRNERSHVGKRILNGMDRVEATTPKPKHIVQWLDRIYETPTRRVSSSLPYNSDEKVFTERQIVMNKKEMVPHDYQYKIRGYISNALDEARLWKLPPLPMTQITESWEDICEPHRQRSYRPQLE